MTEDEQQLVDAAHLFAMGLSREPYHLGTLQRHTGNVGWLALGCDDFGEWIDLHALCLRLMRIKEEGIEPVSAKLIRRDYYPLGLFCTKVLNMTPEQTGAMICPDGTARQQLISGKMLGHVITTAERRCIVHWHFGHHLI